MLMQEDRMKRMHEEQKTAAFNLGTAEAVRTKRSSKPGDSYVRHSSYSIFVYYYTSVYSIFTVYEIKYVERLYA